MQTFSLTAMQQKYGWNTVELDYIRFDLLSFMHGLPAWIAGGAIRRAILKQPISKDADFDIFFKDHATFVKCKDALVAKGATIVRESAENVTFKIKVKMDKEEVDVIIQFIIIRFYAKVDEVLDSFDFTLCQFALDIDGDKLYTGDTALYDVANHRIVINRITYPVASLRRLIKYTRQGFYACQGCLSTFLDEVRNFNGPVLNTQISSID